MSMDSTFTCLAILFLIYCTPFYSWYVLSNFPERVYNIVLKLNWIRGWGIYHHLSDFVVYNT